MNAKAITFPLFFLEIEIERATTEKGEREKENVKERRRCKYRAV